MFAKGEAVKNKKFLAEKLKSKTLALLWMAWFVEMAWFTEQAICVQTSTLLPGMAWCMEQAKHYNQQQDVHGREIKASLHK